MKQKKLNYRFHNSNSAEDTANFLCKLLVEVNAGKVTIPFPLKSFGNKPLIFSVYRNHSVSLYQ